MRLRPRRSRKRPAGRAVAGRCRASTTTPARCISIPPTATGPGRWARSPQAANRAGLDFLVLCDHSSLQARTDGQDGWRGRTLVLIGTEVTTDTGHLLALDVPDSFLPAPGDAVAAQRAIFDSGGLGFIALPCDLKDHWRDFGRLQDGIGLEVFNLSAIARTKINLPALAEVWRRYNSRRPQRAFHLVSARPAPRAASLGQSDGRAAARPARPPRRRHRLAGCPCGDEVRPPLLSLPHL